MTTEAAAEGGDAATDAVGELGEPAAGAPASAGAAGTTEEEREAVRKRARLYVEQTGAPPAPGTYLGSDAPPATSFSTTATGWEREDAEKEWEVVIPRPAMFRHLMQNIGAVLEEYVVFHIGNTPQLHGLAINTPDKKNVCIVESVFQQCSVRYPSGVTPAEEHLDWCIKTDRLNAVLQLVPGNSTLHIVRYRREAEIYFHAVQAGIETLGWKMANLEHESETHALCEMTHTHHINFVLEDLKRVYKLAQSVKAKDLGFTVLETPTESNRRVFVRVDIRGEDMPVHQLFQSVQPPAAATGSAGDDGAHPSTPPPGGAPSLGMLIMRTIEEQQDEPPMDRAFLRSLRPKFSGFYSTEYIGKFIKNMARANVVMHLGPNAAQPGRNWPMVLHYPIGAGDDAEDRTQMIIVPSGAAGAASYIKYALAERDIEVL